MIDLSQNFTLAEMIVTSTGLPNDPGPVELENLRQLTVNVLQPLRFQYGMPIRVNSGYRSAAVNSAVGGSQTSQHCLGQAADLDSTNNAQLFNLIRNSLPFDQLIWEGGNDLQPDWVHVSFSPYFNRRQVLRMIHGRYIPM